MSDLNIYGYEYTRKCPNCKHTTYFEKGVHGFQYRCQWCGKVFSLDGYELYADAPIKPVGDHQFNSVMGLLAFIILLIILIIYYAVSAFFFNGANMIIVGILVLGMLISLVVCILFRLI
jgi:phage FluMu protein Com